MSSFLVPINLIDQIKTEKWSKKSLRAYLLSYLLDFANNIYF